MPLEIVRHDLTKMKVDAIVNAANTELKRGGGVCGAIFEAAGVNELTHACDEIGGWPVGEAVITEGFRLPAKFIIHTPGPIWRGGTHQESELLKNCYLHSLELAKQYKCDSIAFPLISTGIYSYPKEEALQIAISSISSFLLHHDIHVYLVVFDKASFGLSQKLFYSIHEYIDEHYVEEVESTFHRRQNRFELESLQETIDIEEKHSELIIGSNLVDLVEELDESFSARLLRLIDERGIYLKISAKNYLTL